nr:V2 [Grapevine geminivirus A defective DNA]
MWLVFMDGLYSSFQDKRLHPAEILPHVIQWICEKGTAQQLIDWIHGLQSEKEEIFRTLDACSVGPSEEMEGFVFSTWTGFPYLVLDCQPTWTPMNSLKCFK